MAIKDRRIEVGTILYEMLGQAGRLETEQAAVIDPTTGRQEWDDENSKPKTQHHLNETMASVTAPFLAELKRRGVQLSELIEYGFALDADDKGATIDTWEVTGAKNDGLKSQGRRGERPDAKRAIG